MAKAGKMTRRDFLLGGMAAAAAGLSGCATPLPREPISEQAQAENAANFRSLVEAEKQRQEQVYRFLHGGEHANSSGTRHFNMVAASRNFPGLDAHMRNPNLQNYVEQIMQGYNRTGLAFSNRHVEVQARAELALNYMRQEHDRLRAKAALELSYALAQAYSDVFGNGLQQAIESRQFNPTEVERVCGGRLAPDGLLWAYRTMTQYRQVLEAGTVNIMDACSLGCPGNSSFQIYGRR